MNLFEVGKTVVVLLHGTAASSRAEFIAIVVAGLLAVTFPSVVKLLASE